MSAYRFDLRDVQKVVALYCEGMTKSDIAVILSRDESDIQRMLEYAEQMKYLSYSPVSNIGKLDRELADLVRNEFLTDKLKKALMNKMECIQIPITITISPTSMFTDYQMGSQIGTPEYEMYRKAETSSVLIAARRAAEQLSEILLDGDDHIVGLNYGFVVRETIKHIRASLSHNSGKISVVSLFGDLEFWSSDGEPDMLKGRDVNCNELVVQLAQQLGDRGEAVPLNVPGYIPARFLKSTETFDEIRSFLTSHSSYKTIFGSPPSDDLEKPREALGITNREARAKIVHMDTIITGFGSTDMYTFNAMFFKDWLEPKEINDLLTYVRNDLVVGDIGGHFVPSAQGRNDDEVIRFLMNINRRIPAAQPTDFRHVASTHVKGKKGGGVVGITVGARKAKLLFTLLSQNPCPISRLIIDAHCALALLNLIDRDAFINFTSNEGKRLIEGSENWSDGTRRLIPV